MRLPPPPDHCHINAYLEAVVWPPKNLAQMDVPDRHQPYGWWVRLIGNWANLAGCNKIVVWSSTNAREANINHNTHHRGVGTGAYYFMGGPGVDPNYNGTSSEAYAWGKRQAQRALYNISQKATSQRVIYPVVFADIEIPGYSPSYTPAWDNGWNTVYTSPCSGVAKAHYIPASPTTLRRPDRLAELPPFPGHRLGDPSATAPRRTDAAKSVVSPHSGTFQARLPDTGLIVRG